MDIQVFFGLRSMGIFGRIHFATLPDSVGNYPPYEKLRFSRRTTKENIRGIGCTCHHETIIGWKNLHFDLWASRPWGFSPLLSVHYYYHKDRQTLLWKGISIPSPLDILRHLLFRKKLAKTTEATALEGLGALFN